ncbi:hypothetical protein OSJ57_10105 [Sphingomonas sp. HH69]
MTHQTEAAPASVRPAPRAIPLGAARKLTRASFAGIRAEMVSDRQYTLGG